MKTKGRSKFSIVQNNGELVAVSLARIRARRNTSPFTHMHRQNGISAKVNALTFGGGDNRRPSGIGNAFSLPPFLDGPRALSDVIRHGGEGIPATENLIDGFNHDPLIARDSLSRQVGTMNPVTRATQARTMRPMSKTVTPANFKKEFCLRLKSIRVMRGLNQADLALKIGVPPNTYGKYERRSLPPHYLIPSICEVLGVSPAELYPSIKDKKQSRYAAL